MPALDTPDYPRPRQDCPAPVGDSQALAAKTGKSVAGVEDKAYRQAGTAARPMDRQGEHLLYVRDKRFAG